VIVVTALACEPARAPVDVPSPPVARASQPLGVAATSSLPPSTGVVVTPPSGSPTTTSTESRPLASSPPSATVASARPDSTASAAPVPASTATTIAELGAKRPTPGCFCEFERDRIAVSIPCGVTTCVDDQSMTCGADKQVAPGDPCTTSAACFCTVNLDEDNAMQIACGLTACANGTSFTCSPDGTTKTNGACS